MYVLVVGMIQVVKNYINMVINSLRAQEAKRMNTNNYLRIENGFDISKITGAIPQNIGEGFQFNISGKTYTTMGSYTKDKKKTHEYRN